MSDVELSRRGVLQASSALAFLGLGQVALPDVTHAQETSTGPQPKPATAATKAANETLKQRLNFADREDFDNATRGLIAKPQTLTIKDDRGGTVWDLEEYKSFIGIDRAAPDTVNPSLWRNAQLNMQYGLFKVHERIFQVRAYNLANVSFVKGDTGWIVLDAGSDLESTAAAFALVSENLGQFPVHAVVYSHSHGDHYGGVRALVKEADVSSGKAQIIAPQHFSEHAISEFVIAGNAMGRRGIYMYGPLLPRNPQGGVNAGLGQTVSHGNTGLILPTREVRETGEEIVIDGVTLIFQVTPGTEAPAEMNTYLPQFRGMWMAENTTNTMHNILTLRGAQVRDASKWAKFLHETIELYGDKSDFKFQAHHWPIWGNEKVVNYWKKQRDLYKYMHDQTVNLMNKGYTGVEIANIISLPRELETAWYNRGYYGTLKHNSRAIYQFYMGFYDGNPSTLDELPPEEKAIKYLDYMGGAPAVIAKAKVDFENGEYRWVAEALKHVVFADAGNTMAKELLADAYEQMGYQAEAGTWRSVYLQGAMELRHGLPKAGKLETAGPDTVRAMPPEMLFDFLAVRLNGEKAAGKMLSIGFDFTDLGKQFDLTVENGVLNYTNKASGSAAVTISLSKAVLDDIQLGKVSVEQAVDQGSAKIVGDRTKLTEFVNLIDDFPFWFNIVTA